ncbi:hypothetical protein Hanom_Chr06g00530931 [Helianthus anomalus]
MFAMRSFGATVYESVNLIPDPYVFKISGQICHHIGSFCPPSNCRTCFLQMCIYDTEYELQNRLGCFGDHGSSSLDEEVVLLLMRIVDEINALVKLFLTARDIRCSSNVPNFV